MRQFKKEYIVPCDHAQAYDLVNDTESYQDILPYCASSGVLSQDGNTKQAYLDIGYKGFSYRLVTQNTMIRPEQIVIVLKDGPLSHLKGHWRFSAHPEGALVCVAFEYDFDNPIIARLFDQFFEQMVSDVMNRFLHIAQQTESSV